MLCALTLLCLALVPGDLVAAFSLVSSIPGLSDRHLLPKPPDMTSGSASADSEGQASSPCSTERLTLEQLESIVEAVAARDGVSVAAILGQLLHSYSIKQGINLGMIRDNTLLETAFLELLNSVNEIPLKSSSDIGFVRSQQPHRLHPSHHGRVSHVKAPPTPDLMFLGLPPLDAREPPAELKPIVQRIPHMTQPLEIAASLPDMPVIAPGRTLRPPPGARVQVIAASLGQLLPDVFVTVSPLMTLVEALRQADLKFQQVLDFPVPEGGVLLLRHSPYFGCFLVARFADLSARDGFAWKVSVIDKDEQVLFNDVCLPTEREVIIKPGMTITLTYGAM